MRKWLVSLTINRTREAHFTSLDILVVSGTGLTQWSEVKCKHLLDPKTYAYDVDGSLNPEYKTMDLVSNVGSLGENLELAGKPSVAGVRRDPGLGLCVVLVTRRYPVGLPTDRQVVLGASAALRDKTLPAWRLCRHPPRSRQPRDGRFALWPDIWGVATATLGLEGRGQRGSW